MKFIVVRKRHAFGRRGQSLAEILVGIAVVAIVIASSLPLLSVTLKSGTKNRYLQTASFLVQELVNELTVYAEREWNCPPGCSGNYGLYNLSKTSTPSKYYLNKGVTFTWTAGSEPPIAIDNVSYTRDFYVENICRNNATGNIGAILPSGSSCPGGETEDKSTQRVTITVSWTVEGPTQSLSIRKFLTRHRDDVFRQTDWSGGQTTPTMEVLTAPNSKFFIHSNANFSVAGNIQIASGGSANLESSVFNTCPTGIDCGAGFNTIIWQGSESIGTVQFRIASSDNQAGPWTFYGPNSDTAAYYTPVYTPTFVKPAVITQEHDNKRYIRYKVFLNGSVGDPVVNDIIINWSN